MSVTKEAIKTDSTISAMRVAFFWMIKFIIIITTFVAISAVVFAWMDKQFPLGSFIGLIGVLGTVAFGGKAAQSFSKQTPLSVTTMTKVNTIQPKVSGSAEIPQ